MAPALVKSLNFGEDGEEISTNQYGQVRVQFFWDSAQQSFWARVAQPLAGSQWGAQFIPRVGMEVLVEFEQGDPDYPVVVGCLYNGNNMFPYDLPGNKTQSGVKSNSSKGGGGYNELMFEDQKGGEQVRFHAQKDLNSVIENDETRKVGNNQTETIQNSRSATVMMNDPLTVDLGRSVTVATNRLVDGGREPDGDCRGDGNGHCRCYNHAFVRRQLNRYNARIDYTHVTFDLA